MLLVFRDGSLSSIRNIQDLFAYLNSFKHDDEKASDGSHPASLVLELLGEGDVKLRCRHLDSWYQEYAQLRSMPYLHKKLDTCDPQMNFIYFDF